MTRFLFALSTLMVLISCNQTPKTNSDTAKTDIAKVDTAAVPVDSFVSLSESLTKASKKYSFKDDESFDRCFAMTMTDKAGKKIDLPKEVQGELSCVGSAFGFFADRYFVYQKQYKIMVYDMDTKKTAELFSSFDGVQVNLTDVAKDNSKLLFVNVLYNKEDMKKNNYTTPTRIMVVDFDTANLQATAKRKFDREVCWFPVEGNMVNKEDCRFIDNNTISYRKFEPNEDGYGNQDAPMVTLAL